MSSGMSLRMAIAELAEQIEKLRSVLQMTDENEPNEPGGQAVLREESRLVASGAERDLCTYIETVEFCSRRMQKLTHAVALLIARIEE